MTNQWANSIIKRNAALTDEAVYAKFANTIVRRNDTPTETTCRFCGYSWTPRVAKPKKCPLCQRWINKPEPG